MRLPLLATFVVPVLSVCARVNTAQSNGWLDRDQVTKRFSLQLDVIGKWVPFTTVKITWPGTEVNIEHYYNIERWRVTTVPPATRQCFAWDAQPPTQLISSS